uniref:Pirin n=1 Tax=Leptocylindrus danicus TaxID=163516 RepID=A0A7S2LFS9_9STRA
MSSTAASRSKLILRSRALVAGPQPTQDPFLFCVYHKDAYPAATDSTMEAPRRGNGQDFNPSAPYRMYHGDKIPGFPQHPHRGFETITATIDGLIDHADSVGNAGRYGEGDLQWMTAGKGVVHGEMFPLVHKDKPNHTRFFQIWLNLSKKDKMVDPSFAMFWANDVPKYTSADGKAAVTTWFGDYFIDNNIHPNNNKPPPNSWASNPANDVAVLHITLQPGGTIIVPKSHIAPADPCNRSLYLVEGYNLGVNIGGTVVKESEGQCIEVDSSVDMELKLPADATGSCEFLLLQGKPIDEPVVQHGPFVMNTRSEINQAFDDYRRTGFGGWPWKRDDMVFPQDKGRFALLYGEETTPTDNTCSE